ncbi:hypothetical protein Tco_1581827, partial [Tanacetum coccineum]
VLQQQYYNVLGISGQGPNFSKRKLTDLSEGEG